MRLRGKLAILSLLALAAGLAVDPVSGQIVRAGNLIVKVDGGFNPQRLPRLTPVPISLHTRSTLRTADGRRLPTATAYTLEFDRNARLFTRGLPKRRWSGGPTKSRGRPWRRS